MKVLHVIPSYFPAFVYGGPIRSTHQMNLNLVALGAAVRVLTTDANGPERLAESGKTVAYGTGLEVEYLRRTFPPDIALALLWKLRAAVQWADVVHVTAVYSFSTPPALAWAALLGRPVFWSPRGALQKWEASPRRGSKAIWDVLCSFLTGPRTTILAASEREAEAARKRFSRIAVRVVENGVALPERITHQGSSTFRVLFLGRLHVVKGIEKLLEACQLLKGRGHDFRVRIVGPSEPGYLASLQARARQVGLGETIEFMRAVDEAGKAALFAESDVLVLPSFSENFGLVVAESLAHGVPVIVSDKTPWRSVEERGCGRWVPNDAKSLADAMQGLMAADRTTMAAKGREWMRAEFSWEQKATQLLRLYEEAQNAR